MACAICEIRKPKRFCPGVRGDICTICCGTEREVTVHCPLDCPYLQDARKHDKTPETDPDQFPNRDIKVTDDFLHQNEGVLVFLGRTLMAVTLEFQDVVDSDVREALDALIRTYRTLQSGVYYDTRPQNPLAGAVYTKLRQEIEDLQKREGEAGATRTRDSQILGLLVFLQRLELDRNNGRKLGRAFIDFLRSFFDPTLTQPEAPSLIVP